MHQTAVINSRWSLTSNDQYWWLSASKSISSTHAVKVYGVSLSTVNHKPSVAWVCNSAQPTTIHRNLGKITYWRRRLCFEKKKRLSIRSFNCLLFRSNGWINALHIRTANNALHRHSIFMVLASSTYARTLFLKASGLTWKLSPAINNTGGGQERNDTYKQYERNNA